MFRPFWADDQGSGASGAIPCAAREADVTSQPGVVPDSANPDVVLVGGGIMSATLAALLGVVAPQWTGTVFESAADVAGESSQAWNNAGTGHAALCELNYTPAGPDGRVDPAKAVAINEQFQVSRQFWSHLVRGGMSDGSPKTFITPVPHVSFVTGEDGRAYMRNRYEALARQPHNPPPPPPPPPRPPPGRGGPPPQPHPGGAPAPPAAVRRPPARRGSG